MSCNLPSGISTSFHSTARTSFSNRSGCFQRARLIWQRLVTDGFLAKRGDQANDLRLTALILTQPPDLVVEVDGMRPVDLDHLGGQPTSADGSRCPAALINR